MPTALELASRILNRERALRSSYSQLEGELINPEYLRTAERLQILQARQIALLAELVRNLEQDQPPLPAERYYVQHILQPGETLAILALEYDTTIPAIRRVNPGLPQNPRPGQLINIPIEIPEPPEDSIRYIVRRGDTLYEIAQMFGTTVETLVRWNSISDPDVIFPGRILIVPRI